MKSIVYIVMLSVAALSIVDMQQNDLQKSIERGKGIYEEMCISCHLGNGKGLKGTFPPLAQSDYLAKFPNESILAVKYGQKGKITVNGVEYNGMMPNPGISNAEVADVMNYIQNAWGNSNKKIVTEKMVEAIKKPQ